MRAVTPEEGQEAGKRAFEILQAYLDEKARGDGLKKIALRIFQGLNAKKTHFVASDKGVIVKKTPDLTERRHYTKLAIDVYGASAPEKHEHSGNVTVEVVKYDEDEDTG